MPYLHLIPRSLPLPSELTRFPKGEHSTNLPCNATCEPFPSIPGQRSSRGRRGEKKTHSAYGPRLASRLYLVTSSPHPDPIPVFWRRRRRIPGLATGLRGGPPTAPDGPVPLRAAANARRRTRLRRAGAPPWNWPRPWTRWRRVGTAERRGLQKGGEGACRG